MKATVFTKYGPPKDVLEVKEIEKPTPKAPPQLIKIYAAAICWGDRALITGKPFIARLSSGLLKPKHPIPGMEIAGQVEKAGRNVTQFHSGDEIFADISECGFGAFAEYVSVPENALALKPVNITYQEAAATPQYSLVALQGLRDKGKIQNGRKVLINGASGGVGTFAVQIAKAFEAEVTGVCSTRNLELVRSIGADHVIDYTKEDFTKSDQRYDLILDIAANRSVSEYMHVLNSNGRYVAVAFKSSALFLGPLISMARSKNVIQLSHKPNVKDLLFIKELIEAGKVVPIIDRTYPLDGIAEALQHYGEGHPSGKVVINMDHNPQEEV
jgi:NADPH:quinone reductase-like Zn-dependent oxidoreductase